MHDTCISQGGLTANVKLHFFKFTVIVGHVGGTKGPPPLIQRPVVTI